MNKSLNSSMKRVRTRSLYDKEVVAIKKRERSWNKYVVPIAYYNENVHMSQRIDFEKI